MGKKLVVGCFFLFACTSFAHAQQTDIYRRLIGTTEDISTAIEKLKAHGNGGLNRQEWMKPVQYGAHRLKINFMFEDPAIVDSRMIVDRQLYKFFLDKDALNELDLPKVAEKELVTLAKEIDEKCDRRHRPAHQSKPIEPLLEHLEALQTFYELLDKKLTDQQRQRLATMYARNRIGTSATASGWSVLQWLRLLAINKQIPESVYASCEKRIMEKAIEIKKKGNRIAIEEINALLPGYLDKLKPEDAEEIYLLPLAHLLAIIDDPKFAESKAFRYFSEQKDLRISEGLWIFESPEYAISASGKIIASPFPSIRRYQKKSAFDVMYSVISAELAGDQRREYMGIFYERNKDVFASEKGFKGAEEAYLPEGIDVKNHQHLNEWIERALIPEQRRSLTNFVRIHCLFMFGPAIIKERLEKELDDWHVEHFDVRLEAFREGLKMHIDESRDEIAKILEEELKPHFGEESQHILYPKSVRNYEIWLNPILHHTASRTTRSSR
jgi:hypothetical protein